MTRIAKFEWTITGLKINLPPEDEIDDDEDYGKISDASELLLAANAASGTAERKRLKQAAWQALQPLQLDVNYFTGGLFKKQGLSLGRNTGVVEVALTEDNTEWAMDGESTFATKAIQVFASMDKMVGPDFEKGLAKLRPLAEEAARKQAKPALSH